MRKRTERQRERGGECQYTYQELMEMYKNALKGKEMRFIHRELKKIGYLGLEFNDRYPDFAYWVSVVSFVITIAVYVIEAFR